MTRGILAILSGQIKNLAARQGLSANRLDIESHLDETLDYQENRANLVKQFGLVEKPTRIRSQVTRQEINQAYQNYSTALAFTSIKARRQRREGNPTFKHLSKNLWIFKAKHGSVCSICKQMIQVGEEISLFQGRTDWCHVKHAQLA
jgi:hypothetical protein